MSGGIGLYLRKAGYDKAFSDNGDIGFFRGDTLFGISCFSCFVQRTFFCKNNPFEKQVNQLKFIKVKNDAGFCYVQTS